MHCNGPIPVIVKVLEIVRLSIWDGPDERLQHVLLILGKKKKKKDIFTKAAGFYLKHWEQETM